jgi:molecular chaperone IbpA
MRTYDLTPLIRTSIGFDRMTRLMDAALKLEDNAKGYPPYNIAKKGEDEFRITLAVAGFAEEDLEITSHENTLTIKGKSATDDSDFRYLHRGIAGRAFERRFQLADHVKVRGAQLENGLLHVSMEREIPEALKPRSIAIQTVASAPVIEEKPAQRKTKAAAAK